MNNIREKFDAWAKEHSRLKGLIWSEVYGYTYYEEKTAFEAWQAATEQCQKDIAELQAREKELVEALRYVNKELIMYGYQYESKDSINVVLNEALANVRGE